MEYFERGTQFGTGKKITTTDNTRHDIVSTLSSNEGQIRLRPNALTKLYSPKYGFKEKDINDMWSYVGRNINTFLDTIVKFLEENQGIIGKNEIMSAIRDIPNTEFMHDGKIDFNNFKKYIHSKAVLQKTYNFSDGEINELFSAIKKYGDYDTIAKKNFFMWEVIKALQTDEDSGDHITKAELINTIKSTDPNVIFSQINFLKKKSGRSYSWINILLKITSDKCEIIDSGFPEEKLNEWLSKADRGFEMKYLKNIRNMLTSEDNGVDVDEILDVMTHIKRDLICNHQYTEKKRIKIGEWIKKMDPIGIWNYILIKRNQYDISREDIFNAVNNGYNLDSLRGLLPQVKFEGQGNNISIIKDVMRLTIKEGMFKDNAQVRNNAMRHAWETRVKK